MHNVNNSHIDTPHDRAQAPERPASAAPALPPSRIRCSRSRFKNSNSHSRLCVRVVWGPALIMSEALGFKFQVLGFR